MSLPMMKIEYKEGQLNPCNKCNELPDFSGTINMKTKKPAFLLICATHGCKQVMIGDDYEKLFNDWNLKNKDKPTILYDAFCLIDGAKPIIELYEAKHPGQVAWKKRWLDAAHEFLKKYEEESTNETND